MWAAAYNSNLRILKKQKLQYLALVCSHIRFTEIANNIRDS